MAIENLNIPHGHDPRAGGRYRFLDSWHSVR